MIKISEKMLDSRELKVKIIKYYFADSLSHAIIHISLRILVITL